MSIWGLVGLILIKIEIENVLFGTTTILTYHLAGPIAKHMYCSTFSQIHRIVPHPTVVFFYCSMHFSSSNLSALFRMGSTEICNTGNAKRQKPLSIKIEIKRHILIDDITARSIGWHTLLINQPAVAHIEIRKPQPGIQPEKQPVLLLNIVSTKPPQKPSIGPPRDPTTMLPSQHAK